jgi:hypothetical protein
MTKHVLILSGAVLLASCSNSFDPYNKLIGFRVLAVKAEPPDLAPAQTSSVSVLTYDDVEEPTAFSWSWCPFANGVDQGYSCAVTHDQIVKATGVPLPSFDLGSGPTARFEYPLQPFVLHGICDALLGMKIPNYTAIPDCTSSFPINIQLVASAGKTTISAIKPINLTYTATAPRNANPQILGAAISLGSDMSHTPIMGELPTLQRNTAYRLELSIPDSASETFLAVPDSGGAPIAKRETLVITWLVQGGSLDKTRTDFIDGTVSLADASVNTWTTPKTVDYSASSVRFDFVIRDGRGGIGWFSKSVQLQQDSGGTP